MRVRPSFTLNRGAALSGGQRLSHGATGSWNSLQDSKRAVFIRERSVNCILVDAVMVSGLRYENRGKGPILQGLAARAPYSAHPRQLVHFYNERCEMNLTTEQKDALIAFLNSL
jgi:hypothetical protein